MDPEKQNMNMGFKNVQPQKVIFYKYIGNVICCLKIRLLTDI